jgi:hypothetical protein
LAKTIKTKESFVIDNLKLTLAVIAGILIGGTVNMGIIMLGGSLIPPPPGVDVSDAESISASIHLYEAKHFITPLLAHAIGTLVGALVAYLIAPKLKMLISFIIGGFFLLGGISVSFMIPAPWWFIVADLLLAYIPMAWVSSMIGSRLQK